MDGIYRKCKVFNGGVPYLYLFDFKKVLRSEYSVTDNILTLYPETDVYEFQLSESANINIQEVKDDLGNYYSIDFTIKINEIDKDFIKKDVIAIALDRNGKYRILGMFNGLEIESQTITTGGKKNDFNGTELRFKGQEKINPYFINNLADAGFNVDGIVTFDFLLQENGDFLLQENGFKIIL